MSYGHAYGPWPSLPGRMSVRNYSASSSTPLSLILSPPPFPFPLSLFFSSVTSSPLPSPPLSSSPSPSPPPSPSSPILSPLLLPSSLHHSYSLSRSNQAIASLYISLFPLFPSSSTDSRYHLQALRHLYVLAVEPKVLVTRDVETGQARSVKVHVKGQQEFNGRTPCILPEWTSIEEVSAHTELEEL